MIPINPATPLVHLTVGELSEIINTQIEKALSEQSRRSTKHEMVHGLRGLANVFGCTIRHAQTLKSSGKYDKAIKQDGRKITTDVNMLLEIMGNVGANTKRNR